MRIVLITKGWGQCKEGASPRLLARGGERAAAGQRQEYILPVLDLRLPVWQLRFIQPFCPVRLCFPAFSLTSLLTQHPISTHMCACPWECPLPAPNHSASWGCEPSRRYLSYMGSAETSGTRYLCLQETCAAERKTSGLIFLALPFLPFLLKKKKKRAWLLSFENRRTQVKEWASRK